MVCLHKERIEVGMISCETEPTSVKYTLVQQNKQLLFIFVGPIWFYVISLEPHFFSYTLNGSYFYGLKSIRCEQWMKRVLCMTHTLCNLDGPTPVQLIHSKINIFQIEPKHTYYARATINCTYFPNTFIPQYGKCNRIKPIAKILLIIPFRP